MASGGGHLQRPPRLLLTDHIGEVGRCTHRPPDRLFDLFDGRFNAIAEIAHDVAEGGGANDPDALNHRSFGPVGGRQDHLFDPVVPGGDDHGQHAAHRLQAALQRQLAHQEPVIEPNRRQITGRGEKRHGPWGRSRAAPSLRSSAGARLKTTLAASDLRPRFLIAEKIRSLASRTAGSGRPTTLTDGWLARIRSTSTVTNNASTPRGVAENAFANIELSLRFAAWIDLSMGRRPEVVKT